ncbi:11659_t:CDS:2, partial [Funneliformis mosseae]
MHAHATNKKRQKLYEKQLRLSNGKFGSKKLNDNQDNDASELEVSGYWGDSDDSGWESEINLENEKKIQSNFMKIKL